MKIGILTFYRVVNFGANLQALSTYRYLEKNGHTPVMINYQSVEMQNMVKMSLQNDPQAKAHIQFVEKLLPNQTPLCATSEEVGEMILRERIEGMIVGSDAVIQHHPLLSRIHRGRRKPVYIERVVPERMFPNPAWGQGVDGVKVAMMSASSQNSRFDLFSWSLKKKMRASLERFGYISVRDTWTQRMLCDIMGNEYPITPDPVFAFNQNVGDLVPSKEFILKKFTLPEKYVLISLMSQSINERTLSELKALFKVKGLSCVALPMPTGHGFSHNFDYQIPEPLDPLDWYALIKYSSGYVGSNMHPIIVCLHNGVPCFSIDNWGSKDFFNRPINNGSSKIEDILRFYGVEGNHKFINGQRCDVIPAEIVNAIRSFPKGNVQKISSRKYEEYGQMMNGILSCLKY